MKVEDLWLPFTSLGHCLIVVWAEAAHRGGQRSGNSPNGPVGLGCPKQGFEEPQTCG